MGLWEFLSQLGKWFLDLLLWLLEWIFEIVNMFFEWIVGFTVDLLEEFIDLVAPHIPANLSGVISDVFMYLSYIEPWFPVKFGLSLFIAYYGAKFVLLVVKWILKLIPGIWG
jgi:hypothetical protein